MMARRMTLRFLSLCTTVLLMTPAPASAAGIIVQGVDTDEYPEVRMSLALTGDLVPDEGDPVFVVLENGIEAPDARAKVVTEARDPVDAVLVLDVSGSMQGEPLAASKAAARSFVAGMSPEDRVAVVAFGSQPRLLSGFTSDKAVLSSAIGSTQAGGNTALHDGLVLAAKTFEDNGRDRYVAVLSDGADDASINTLNGASEALSKAAAAVYAVALESPTYDSASLQALANSSGGRLVSVQNAASLAAIFEDIAREIRNVYDVAFTSARPSTKDLEIKITARNGDVSGSLLTAVENPQFSESALAIDEEPATSASRSPFATFALGALVLFAVTMCVWVLGSMLAPEQSSINDLRYYEQAGMPPDSPTEAAGADTSRGRVLGVIGYVADRRGYTSMFRTSLERAGMPLRVNEYIFLHLVFTLGVGAIALILTGRVTVVLLAAVLAAGGPLLALRIRIDRRRAAFEEQLPDVLSLIAGSLRAGWGIQQSISLVVQEVAQPSAGEFRRVESETRFGLPFEDALGRMADRVQSDDFRWTVAAITIQREVGGNLAEVLDIVAKTIRERAELRRHVHALSAESRFSAIVLSVMPFFAIAALSLVAPRYIGVMLASTGGLLALGGGGLLLVIGIFWMIRLTKVEI